MSQFDEANIELSKRGFSERVPASRARYYNQDYFGGYDGRGSICRIRLLNVSDASKQRGSSFEQRILQEIGGAESRGMASFLVQAVSMQDQEKSMVMQTFGDGSAVYFFGRAPRMMSISGVLLDDVDNNWFYKFMVAYNKFLRGTRVAKNFRLIALELPNAVATGVIMDINYNQTAANDSLINFSMNFLVKEYEPISAMNAKDAAGNLSPSASFSKKALTSELPTLTKADVTKLTAVQETSPLAGSIPLAFGNQQVSVASKSIVTNGDYYPGIYISGIDGSAVGQTFFAETIPFSVKSSSLSGSDDQSKGSNEQLATLDYYKTTMGKARQSVSAVRKFLSKIETALKDVTNFFNNVATGINDLSNAANEQIRSILDPVSSIINAANSTLDSVKNVVSAVNRSVDQVLGPIVHISQDFNALRENFKDTRGVILSFPQTISNKVSAMLNECKFENFASLGSMSSGITSDEAMAVLALTNSVSADSLGQISPPVVQRQDETKVYIL